MHCTIISPLITIKVSLRVFLLLLKLTSMAGSLGLGEGLGS
jgi:hypothetical protein